MEYDSEDCVVVTREDDEVRNRSSYRFTLLLLALLPYLYVLITLAIIFTLVGLVLWAIITGEGRDGWTFRIQLALAVVAAKVLRSIWVRIPPPEDEATPDNKPPSALLTTTHEIARAVRGPKIHTILWTEEFDMTITPVPRLSLLGWPSRYYLRIGLPLMHALSPEQFRAMLAQELGHFSQGRFRSWIYHDRFTWASLLSALDSRGRWGSWFFSRFFAWYVPFILNYTVAASRYHEYEADRSAAYVTSAEVTAEALIRSDYGSYLTNEYWDNDYEEAEQAGFDSYSYIADFVELHLNDDEAEAWLSSEEEENTHSTQLHPELRDRLTALGQTLKVPAPITQCAAEVYLGDHLPEITERLERAREERTGLAWHDPNPDSGSDAHTIFAQGVQLLDADREEGVAVLEQAMKLDPALTAAACARISSFYNRQADIITSRLYARRARDHWRYCENAAAERTLVSFIETFLPHNFSDWEIDQLRTELGRHAEIKEAYLVRKEVSYFPNKPLHALGVVLDRGWFKKPTEDLSFANRLPPARKYPTELYTFVLHYKNRRVGNAIRDVPNSLVYQKIN